MKVFISADIEGTAGVTTPEHCSPGRPEYETARALMEQEINAAIDGAFAGGASVVVVADSHSSGQNLRADKIDPRARLVQGSPRPLSMIEGFQQEHFDGLILVGFHSAARIRGVLAHTINSRAFHQVKINGETVGEADIFAAFAAEQGTPLWLVSGDDQLQQWIEHYYPGTDYVRVKRAISNTAAESISPAEARKALTEQVARQVASAPANVVKRFDSPYRLELTVTRPVLADLYGMVPGIERIDAVTVGYETRQISRIISLLSIFSTLSATKV
ncbi:M55 family metallopeptidase [Klebsiella pneumoniae]|uniref:M55 family metallopeptidase n=1 Tax=Klebsiella pneumoniae TaxID=573 RepID=UPI0040373F08